jgi:hypothetical protein
MGHIYITYSWVPLPYSGMTLCEQVLYQRDFTRVFRPVRRPRSSTCPRLTLENSQTFRMMEPMRNGPARAERALGASRMQQGV